jgi:YHS domain-containing protein
MANATSTPPSSADPVSSAICPGCGKAVDPLRAGHVAILDGRFAYFCDAECKAQRFRGPASTLSPDEIETAAPPPVVIIGAPSSTTPTPPPASASRPTPSPASAKPVSTKRANGAHANGTNGTHGQSSDVEPLSAPMRPPAVAYAALEEGRESFPSRPPRESTPPRESVPPRTLRSPDAEAPHVEVADEAPVVEIETPRSSRSRGGREGNDSRPSSSAA